MIDAGSTQLPRQIPAVGGDRPRKHGRERTSPRPDQRSRLVDAIVAVVADHGYGGAKIGDIATRAGVSRATFYEMFIDKEECFLAAHDALSTRVSNDLDEELGGAAADRAAHAAVSALANLAGREPAVFSFLTHEALLAGPRARERRDRLLGRIETMIKRSWQQAFKDGPVLEIHPGTLVGGVVRLLGIDIRRSAQPTERLLPELHRWVDSYAAPAGSPRWHELLFAPLPLRVGSDRHPRPTFPRTLPRGRHRLPKDVVESVQRERIAYATAEVIKNRDATSVAVAEIVAAAGVSREVFYAHFRDKEQAFLATHQLIFEQLMAATTSAFFTPDTTWPERVWEAGLAFTELLAARPSFAHFGFVSAYGIGEIGVRRVDETILAFGLFLEEGYRYRPEAAELPRLVSDVIAVAIMELCALYVRADRTEELPRLVPAVTYTALAPFMGSRAAGEFVDARLNACRPLNVEASSEDGERC